MSLRNSNHLTTHCQQLLAYRTYEELLNGLPHQLQDSDALIQIADTLLHLKVYDLIIAQCLRLSGALQHVDLANMLACPVSISFHSNFFYKASQKVSGSCQQPGISQAHTEQDPDTKLRPGGKCRLVEGTRELQAFL